MLNELEEVNHQDAKCPKKQLSISKEQNVYILHVYLLFLGGIRKLSEEKCQKSELIPVFFSSICNCSCMVNPIYTLI